ncbi:MAG TPA: hypothetical protein PKI11_14020 [Candidatus Hydrogenedentes bacterium]|nr:hypothetical protein [Candidatus Hydrogenedentota bacterium]
MECMVCEVRAAAGRCPVCGKPLCESCGAACEVCGRPSCGNHTYWTSAGQALCKKCMHGHRGNRAAPAPARPSEQPTRAASSTSFAALRDAAPYIEEDSSETDAPRQPKKEISSQALSGSAPRGTPVWVSSIFVGGLAWVLLIPLVPFLSRGNVFRQAQPWMSYCIVLLGLGAMVWAGAGAVGAQPRRERWLCLIGLAMGLGAAVVAFLVRLPGPPA